MGGGLFFFGICIGVSVIIFGQAVVNSVDNEHCAKENNVFACKKVVTWVPVVPKD